MESWSPGLSLRGGTLSSSNPSISVRVRSRAKGAAHSIKVQTSDPLAQLVAQSQDLDAAEAPVERMIVRNCGLISLALLLAAGIGFFISSTEATDQILFKLVPGLVQWSIDSTGAVAWPSLIVACAGLAFDASLWTGRAVGEWGRWALLAQIGISTLLMLPALLFCLLIVTTVAAWVALGVLVGIVTVVAIFVLLDGA